MDIEYKLSNSDVELEGILSLQAVNLKQNIDSRTQEKYGFVTVKHTFDQLKKLNNTARHIIAKFANSVIAYALAMTDADSETMPQLKPMFELFNKINFNGKLVSEYKYIVIGQACVDEKYRGMGVLDGCYAKYKEVYSPLFDFAITEIAVENIRSLKAHSRVGFKPIHQYIDFFGVEWYIVIWSWN